jgi:hypothetical protein
MISYYIKPSIYLYLKAQISVGTCVVFGIFLFPELKAAFALFFLFFLGYEQSIIEFYSML